MRRSALRDGTDLDDNLEVALTRRTDRNRRSFATTMANLIEHPFWVFVASIAVLSISVAIGDRSFRPYARAKEEDPTFGVVLAAALTLLGLIIGFSFSLAASRYDQRKNLEEAEANAIGTEYLRVGLLADADPARKLLQQYLDQRIQFYALRDEHRLREVDAQNLAVQDQLWAAIRSAATAQPNAVVMLVASGMNDVFNSASYTQAAWWNRVPIEAWVLMFLIAVLCNAMVGVGARQIKTRRLALILLPLLVSIAFSLIADIDSPRGGFIHIAPQNLRRLAETMH